MGTNNDDLLTMMGTRVDDCLSTKDNFAIHADVKSIHISGERSGDAPKVAIGIPAYKRVGLLRETMQSILAQQGFDDYEIIVSDDNPERGDETEKYIAELASDRIRYYKNERNIGMTANWNRLVELCESPYIVLLHDDDLLYPNYLAEHFRLTTIIPEADIIFSTKAVWNDGGAKPVQQNPERCPLYQLTLPDVLMVCENPPTGVFMKTDSVRRLGGYDETAYPSCDYYFNVKAICHANVWLYDKHLFIYRWGQNVSMRYDTLVQFLRQDIPLKKWMMRRMGWPRFLQRIVIEQRSVSMVGHIGDTHPDKMKEFDWSIVEMPASRLKKAFDQRITDAYSRFLKWRHRHFSRKV